MEHDPETDAHKAFTTIAFLDINALITQHILFPECQGIQSCGFCGFWEEQADSSGSVWKDKTTSEVLINSKWHHLHVEAPPQTWN